MNSAGFEGTVCCVLLLKHGLLWHSDTTDHNSVRKKQDSALPPKFSSNPFTQERENEGKCNWETTSYKNCKNSVF